MENKKLLSCLVLICCSVSIYPMLRRFAPRAVLPVVGSFELMQKRHLLPGQEKEKPWVEINKKIEKMHKEFGISSEELLKMPDGIFSPLPADMMLPGALPLKDTRMLDLIEATFKKHNVDPMSMYYADSTGLNVPAMGVFQDKVLLIDMAKVQSFSDIEIIAFLEHEICHILCKDCQSRVVLADIVSQNTLTLEKASEQTVIEKMRDYVLLQEQRADTHAALQSLQNAQLFCGKSGYAWMVKGNELKKLAKQQGSDFEQAMDLKVLHIAQNGICKDNDDLFFDMILAFVKDLEMQGRISSADVGKFEKWRKEPTYAQELVSYVKNRDKGILKKEKESFWKK